MSAYVTRERTFAITILAALAAIAGVLSLLDAARYMGWLAFTVGDGLKFFLPQAQWFAAIMAAIVGVIYFVVASWLWNLNPSGWLFVVAISIINLIFLFLAILGRTTFGDVALQIALNAVVLILALLPSTKRAFMPAPSPDAVAAVSGRADAARSAAAAGGQQAAAGVQAGAVAAAAAKNTADAAADTVADVAGDTADAIGDAANATVDVVGAGIDEISEVVEVDIEPNDLTQIEGIGPKISEVLQAAGITTYAQLASMSADDLHKIVSAAGISADPSQWAQQASLAAAGDWDALKAFQDELKGGHKA